MKTDLNVKLISMEDIMAAKCCDIQEVIRVIEEVLVDYKNGEVMGFIVSITLMARIPV